MFVFKTETKLGRCLFGFWEFRGGRGVCLLKSCAICNPSVRFGNGSGVLLLVHPSELQPRGTCGRAGLVLLCSPWFIWSQTWGCGKQPRRVKFTSAYNPGTSMAMGIHTLVNQDLTRTKRWADSPINPQVCCTSFRGPCLPLHLLLPWLI